MVVDFDDYCEGQSELELLHQLREINPKFRCTLFAIPGRGTDEFWSQTPEWCELAVHGWMHPTPWEARDWSYERTVEVMDSKPERFVEGFKAPGWQVSPETYLALRDRDWWLADHYENAERIPDGLRRHVISIPAGNGADPDHWHGHIQNVCGNGLRETFHTLVERVREAKTFELISEVVQ